MLQLLLLAALALLAANARGLRAALAKQTTRWGLRWLAALTLLALAARLFGPEPFHRVFYDELEHLDLAANVARLGAYAQTVVGGLDDFDVLKPPPLWPAGWHVMLGALFKFTGLSEGGAYALTAALGALCVPLAWAVALLAFEDEVAALSAAAILTASPLALKYATCADLSTPSLFWLLLAFAAFLYSRERRGALPAALFAACAGYAANARLENAAACAVLAAAWAHSRAPRERWLAASLLTLAAAPAVALVAQNAAMARNVLKGSPLYNTAANLAWLCDPLSERGALTALAVLGAYCARSTRRPVVTTFAAFGAVMLVAVGFHEFGRFALWYNYTASDRYALALLPALLPLAGLGVSRLASGRRLAVPAVGALFALLALPSMSVISNTILDEQDRALWLAQAGRVLPEDVYVITHSPHAARVLLRRPAVDAAWLLENRPAFDERVARQGRGSQRVLFQDYWWEQRWHVSMPLERALWADYDFSLQLEQEVADKRYAFYLLLPRRAPRVAPAIWTPDSLTRGGVL